MPRKPKLLVFEVFFIFLLCFSLFGTVISSDIQYLSFSQKTSVKFRQNEEITFGLLNITSSDSEKKLYLSAKLAQGHLSKFLEPQIKLVSQSEKTILVCNQVSNKFYKICSIDVKDLPKLTNLKVKILSLVEAEIEIFPYVQKEYNMQIGKEILLEADQQLDQVMQTQLLMMQIPADFKEFERIDFSLVEMNPSPYPFSAEQTKMSVYHGSSPAQIQVSHNKNASQTFLSRKGLFASLKKSQVNPGDYILVNITFKDQFSRLRFHTTFSVQDTLINQKAVVGDLTAYYSFQMIESDIMFLRFDNVLKQMSDGQQFELVLYHFSGNVYELKFFADPDSQKYISLYPEDSKTGVFASSSQSYYQQIIRTEDIKTLFTTEMTSQQDYSKLNDRDLYLQITSSDEPVSFYISLRFYQKDRSIEEQFPEIIQLNNMNLVGSQNSNTKLVINGFNYVYEDYFTVPTTQSTVQYRQKYTIEVNDENNYFRSDQNSHNSVSVLARRCQSIDEFGTVSCFDQSRQALINAASDASEIIVKVQHPHKKKHKTLFTFEYELSKCPVLLSTQDYLVHKCYFNIFFYVMAQSTTEYFYPFSFTLHKASSLVPITVPSQPYAIGSANPRFELSAHDEAYFHLSISSKQKSGLTALARTTIHLTSSFGDCIIFGSKSEKYPTFDLIEQKNYDVGIKGFLQIDKLQLSSGIFSYYFAVYCYEDSAFDIQAITKNLDKDVLFANDVPLSEGRPQEMVLREKDRVRFTIENTQNVVLPQHHILQLDQLEGIVNFEVYSFDQNGQKLVTDCPVSLNNEITCTFSLDYQQKVYVQVWPNKVQNDLTRFIILTNTKVSCLYYPSNRPQFIYLQTQQKVCTRFKVTKYDDLQITLSMTDLEFLSSNLNAYLTFNNNPAKIPLKNMMTYLSPTELKSYCDTYRGPEQQNSIRFNSFIDCEFQLTIQSSESSNNVTLTQVIQYTGEESMLLNGLQRLSNIEGLSRQHYKKYFYYTQQSSSDLKISFYSQNNKDLTLAARVVNAKAFQTTPNDLYPTYSTAQDSQNIVVRLENGHYSGHMYIPASKLTCQSTAISGSSGSKVSSDCVLLISVFGTQSTKSSQELFIYTLEVNQGYTLVQIGQSVDEIAENGKNQLFQVMTLKNVDSLIQIITHDVDSKNQKCFQAYVYPSEVSSGGSLSTVGSNGKFVLKAGASQIFIVEVSLKQNLPIYSRCKYKLSYTSLKNPVFEIQQSSLVHVSSTFFDSQESQRFSFLLYHDVIIDNKQDKNWQVIPIFDSLSSPNDYNLYATQIDIKSLQNGMTSLLSSILSDQTTLKNAVNISSLLSNFKYSQTSKGSQSLGNKNQYKLPFKSSNLLSNVNEKNTFRYFLILIENIKINQTPSNYSGENIHNNNDQSILSLQVVQLGENIILEPSSVTINNIQSGSIGFRNEKTYDLFVNLKSPSIIVSPTIYLNFDLVYGQAKIVISDPNDRSMYEKIVSQPSSSKDSINIASIVSLYKPIFTRIPDQPSKLKIKIIAMSPQVLYSLKLQTVNLTTDIINLKEKISYIAEFNQVKSSDQSDNRIFIIDARPCNLTNHQNETINLVISLVNEQNNQVNISQILTQIQINSSQWNQRTNSKQWKTFNLNQVLINKHMSFYSIRLPTIPNGKYHLALSKLTKKVKLSISYLLLSKNVSSSVHSLIPVSSQLTNTRILPMGSVLEMPMFSASENLLLSFSSCFVQSPQFIVEESGVISTLNIIQNETSGFSPMIYLKSKKGGKIYIKVGSNSTQISQVSISSQRQFLLNLITKPTSYLGQYFRVEKGSDNSINFSIKDGQLQLIYSQLIPNTSNINKNFENELDSMKLRYSLFASTCSSALMKKSKCKITTFNHGKQVSVFSKIIDQISLRDLVQKFKDTDSAKLQPKTIILNLNDLFTTLNDSSEAIYLNLKVSIVQQTDTSGSLRNLQQSSSMIYEDTQTYFYKPVKVTIDRSQPVSSSSNKALMIILVLLGILLLFALLFFLNYKFRIIQKLCRKAQSALHEQNKVPSIKISSADKIGVPNNDHSHMLSVSDGFSITTHSSENIMKTQEFGIKDLTSRSPPGVDKQLQNSQIH